MGLSQTERLKLPYYDKGNLDWSPGFNAAQEEADDRFFKQSTTNQYGDLKTGSVWTATNPAVITVEVGHGFVNGDTVECENFAGGTWDTINGNKYEVTVAGNDITLVGCDASGFGVATAGDLKEYWAGEDPNDWDGSGDSVVGDYVGQRYLSETLDPPVWWTCTTAGDADTAVWEKLDTTGIESPVAKNGKTNLEDILADFSGRIIVLESLPRGHIDGLVMGCSNDEIFSIAAGESVDETQVKKMIQAANWTKNANASWAAGTGNGAMSSSLSLTNGWYHVFQVYKITGDITDIAIDSDIDHSNLETDHEFDYFHRIGSLYADGDDDLMYFFGEGDLVWWTTPPITKEIAPAATGLSTVFSPADIRCMVYMQGRAWDDAVNRNAHVQSPDSTQQAPSNTDSPLMTYNTGTSNRSNPNNFQVFTNTSSQIRFNIQAGGLDNLYYVTLGYRDPRGRDRAI